MKNVYCVYFESWSGSYIVSMCATREIAERIREETIKENYDEWCKEDYYIGEYKLVEE